jgi:alcohol dehydrogenase
MKARQMDRSGTAFLYDIAVPEVRPGSVLVRVEALSYLKDYVDPRRNAIGVIEAVGGDVWHLKLGQRVVISCHLAWWCC